MSLKFKRNLPIILFLIVFLSLLAFTMGDQRIISYTIGVGSQRAEQGTSLRYDIIDDNAFLVGSRLTQGIYDDSRISFAYDALYVIHEPVEVI